MWHIDLCHYSNVNVGTLGLVLSQDPQHPGMAEKRVWMQVLIDGQVMLALSDDLEVVDTGVDCHIPAESP